MDKLLSKLQNERLLLRQKTNSEGGGLLYAAMEK